MQVRYVVGESFYHASTEETEEQLQEGMQFYDGSDCQYVYYFNCQGFQYGQLKLSARPHQCLNMSALLQ